MRDVTEKHGFSAIGLLFEQSAIRIELHSGRGILEVGPSLRLRAAACIGGVCKALNERPETIRVLVPRSCVVATSEGGPAFTLVFVKSPQTGRLGSETRWLRRVRGPFWVAWAWLIAWRKRARTVRDAGYSSAQDGNDSHVRPSSVRSEPQERNGAGGAGPPRKR